MRISANDVDIYWQGEPFTGLGKYNLVVYCCQEPSPMSNILLENAEGQGKNKKPLLVANVISKLSRCLPFFDKDADIGTKVYLSGNTLIVRFNDFHPVSSGNHWLFGYPIVRETIEAILDNVDIESVGIFSSTMYTDSEHFTPTSKSMYECIKWSDNDKYVLPMFAWVTGYLCELRRKDAELVLFNSTPEKMVSMPMLADGISVLEELGVTVNEKGAIDSYEEYSSEIESMMENLELFSVDVKKDEVMFS